MLMAIKEVVKVNSRGMITIPSDLRKKFGITEGTEIAVIEDEGKITIVPLKDIEDLRSQFASKEKIIRIMDESYNDELELES